MCHNGKRKRQNVFLNVNFEFDWFIIRVQIESMLTNFEVYFLCTFNCNLSTIDSCNRIYGRTPLDIREAKAIVRTEKDISCPS